jgi:hypothetical protein
MMQERCGWQKVNPLKTRGLWKNIPFGGFHAKDMAGRYVFLVESFVETYRMRGGG